MLTPPPPPPPHARARAATTHPPGGATALIVASLDTLPKWHGYSYLITVLIGSLAMQLVALVINNLNPRRRYPTYWW